MRSVGLDVIVKDSFRVTPSILCPDHVVKCAASGRIAHPDDVIVTKDEKKCHESLVGECHLCDTKANSFWARIDLSQHSERGDILLCHEHARQCSQTKRILLPSEVVELSSKEHVGIDLADICVECKSKKEEHQYHLKSKLKSYSLDNAQSLCSKHEGLAQSPERY
jgi:hypothetical protein